MTTIDRDQRNDGRPERVKLWFIAALLAMLTVTLALRSLLPAEAVVPGVATLLFALAAGATLFGLLRRDRITRMTWFDAAGILTFAGVAVSILTDPDQLVRLIALPDQSE